MTTKNSRKEVMKYTNVVEQLEQLLFPHLNLYTLNKYGDPGVQIEIEVEEELHDSDRFYLYTNEILDYNSVSRICAFLFVVT